MYRYTSSQKLIINNRFLFLQKRMKKFFKKLSALLENYSQNLFKLICFAKTYQIKKNSSIILLKLERFYIIN